MATKDKSKLTVAAVVKGAKAQQEAALPPSDRERHLRKANADLALENKNLREKLGEQQEFYDQVTGAVTQLDPYPAFRYTSAQKRNTPIVPVIDFSDWHIGEVVKADEVEGFNAFNWEIAQAGLFGLVQEFLQWVQIQRQFYRIDACAVIGKGDYVSGDIHDELKATNEFPLPVQAAKAGTLLGEVLRILAGHFKTVQVFECGADNHGRLQRKPQAKQKSSNNMSFLVHYIANAHAERCHNLRIETAKGIKLLGDINGKKFLIEHGDTMKGWSGLPFYAFAREIGKEAMRRMNTERGFDYLSIGHFHTPCLIENRTILNGSLSGTSEFDHACGRHSLPCQVAYLVHPRYGVFNFTPFVRRDAVAKVKG